MCLAVDGKIARVDDCAVVCENDESIHLLNTLRGTEDKYCPAIVCNDP